MRAGNDGKGKEKRRSAITSGRLCGGERGESLVRKIQDGDTDIALNSLELVNPWENS